MKKIFFVAMILILVGSPLVTNAFSLVPCGSSEYPEPCELKHMFVIITRLINYLMSAAAIVAMRQVLQGGFGMVTAMGNPEKIKSKREAMTQGVVGFGMILMAFVFVNLLVNGLFGNRTDPRRWWDASCLYTYDITSAKCQNQQ